MFRFDTRQDENVTVRNVSTAPRLNETTAVRSVTCGTNVDPERGEQAARGDGEAEGERDAEDDADECGHQVVRSAFREEHLDKMETLGADRTRHAHLGLPLGSEHDEDHHDEEHSSADREQSEEEEERGHEVADLLGLFDERRPWCR